MNTTINYHIAYVWQQLCLNKRKKTHTHTPTKSISFGFAHHACWSFEKKFLFADTIPSDLHTYSQKMDSSKFSTKAIFLFFCFVFFSFWLWGWIKKKAKKNEINYESCAKWKAFREMNFIYHGAVFLQFSPYLSLCLPF